MVPMGNLVHSHPVLRQLRLPPLGRAARGHVLLTKTLLIVGQEGSTQRERSAQREVSAELGAVMVPNFQIHDPQLCAYDKATGTVVGEVALPRNATGAPMTYMLNGTQCIVVPTGGANLPAELIVLCLP
jgi:quinoprotein glucose dehydrogenase